VNTSDAAAIRQLTPDEVERALPVLSALLVDAVDSGASVNFMAGFTLAEAEGYWRRQLEGFRGGDRIWLAAEAEGGIVGMVMCVFAPQPNQPYRADVSKMIVHSRMRNRGVGALLMVGIEAAAAKAGKTLLVLDTEAGSAGDRLYRRMGWTPFGTVPGYAYATDGRTCAATFFYKRLAPAPAWEK
jgi:GNAT superfamily N-acetyltransferase